MGHHLAQINVGRLHHPLGAAETAEFAAAIGPINALAEATPGFVWRLTDDSGASSSHVALPGEDDPLLIVNYSIWTDVDSLAHFMFKSGHASYLRRRREWFQPMTEESTAYWWVPAGTIPSTAEAYERLGHLRRHGPSAQAWTRAVRFDPPA